MKYITFLLSLLMLGACSSSSDDSVLQKSRVSIDVSGFDIEVEPVGGRATTLTGVTHLSVAVYDAEGTLVKSANQVSSLETFGTVEMELYPGEYQLVAVAHNGAEDATINSTTLVTLPGTRFTDTFSKVQGFTVESGKDCSVSTSLSRIASAFILRIADNPPADAKEIQVVVNTAGMDPASLTVDPSTGCATNNWKQTCTIPVSQITTDVPVYFIGMFPVCSVTVKATAYNTADEEIISHTITGVPLQPNHRTIASGNFFQSSGSAVFTIDLVWGADKHVDF